MSMRELLAFAISTVTRSGSRECAFGGVHADCRSTRSVADTELAEPVLAIAVGAIEVSGGERASHTAWTLSAWANSCRQSAVAVGQHLGLD